MNCTAGVVIRTIDARDGAVPRAVDAWLSPSEREHSARLRDAQRRAEWLAGRWLFKGMLARELGHATKATPPLQPSEIEILSRDALGRAVIPRAFVAGRLLPWHLSLAHSGGMVSAALSTAADLRVGIDVVTETSSLDQSGLWFTAREHRLLQQSDDPMLASTFWAVKEAVYKAINRGEPFVPADFDVMVDEHGHYRCRGRNATLFADDAIQVRRRRTRVLAVVRFHPRNSERDVRHD